MDTDEFGPWLARQLRRQGMSQQEMADRVAVTRAAVSAWVTGRATPRPDTLPLIAEALGVEALSLYSLAEEPLSTSALKWYHRQAYVDGGREMGNAAAFAFEPSLSALVREATQNSLDERYDEGRPVRMHFSVHEITGNRLFQFLDAIHWDRLEAHYAAAATTAQKMGRKLSAALQVMREQSRLTLLRVDDYNASGLTGDDFDDKTGDDRFAAVMRRQLDSYKTNSTVAGGSFGLGKATLWAASGLGLVFANSTLSTPFEGKTERRVIGRLDLPWRRLADGTAFAGPAWFGEPSSGHDGATRSWWADADTVSRLHLTRDTSAPGTSFLIVGVPDTVLDTSPEGSSGDRDSDSARIAVLRAMHDELVTGLSDNFWAAMVGGGGSVPILEASVTTLRNGATVIPEERVRPETRQPARTRALRAFFERTTAVEPASAEDVAIRRVALTVPPLADRHDGRGTPVTHEAILLLTQISDSSDEPCASDRLVYMRGNRMQIQERPINEALAAAKYTGVLLAGHASGDSSPEADAAEAFLRAAEPPEHNAWKKTDDLVTAYARGAATRLEEFRRAVMDAVRDVTRRRDATPDEDGPALLRELLTLNAPPRVHAPGYPTVRRIDGHVDQAGAWVLEVEVRLPLRSDGWHLQPVLKFVTRSGPHLAAGWARLEAVTGCTVGEGSSIVLCPGNVRSAVFKGISEVSSHPVVARMSRATVDLRTTKGEPA